MGEGPENEEERLLSERETNNLGKGKVLLFLGLKFYRQGERKWDDLDAM